MNDEQIKQNAEAYADIFGRHMADYYGVKDAYIAGAHSRDEEIKELKKQRDNFKDRLLDALEKRDQLRNPWINVEERLPEKALTICAVWLNGDDLVPHISLYDSGRFLLLPIDVTVTHWMYIPELQKGE